MNIKEDQDLLGKMKADFLSDLPESVDSLRQDLARLRNHPKDKEIAKKIERAAHSIKSCASFYPELFRMKELSYKMEIMFRSIYDGKLEVGKKMIDLAGDASLTILSLGNEKEIDTSRIEAEFDEIIYPNKTGLQNFKELKSKN